MVSTKHYFRAFWKGKSVMKHNTFNLFKSGRSLLSVAAIGFAALLVVGAPVFGQDDTKKALPNIVLVHGAWADGSSWSGVIERLQADGYKVTAPQFSLSAIADDVAKLRRVLRMQTGPTIVVGHSYGGQIITALGEDAPNVVGLVYFAAFGLDEGESIGALLADGPTPSIAHLIIDDEAYAWLPEDDFVNHFIADVDPAQARVLYAAQQPLHLSALEDVMGVPAWKSFPSWYMVATHDETIPPDAERLFAQRMGATTTEIDSSHVPTVSHPDEAVAFIEQAAQTILTSSPEAPSS
jgi:pimeloyl-ACP methyl ester carboxylesterase